MMTLRFELFVNDVAKAAEFYEKILGFTRGKQTEEYVGVRNGNVRIGLGLLSNLPCNHPLRLYHASERKGVGVEIVIEVDRVDKLYDAVRTAGYPIFEPLMVRPWGLSDFRIVDPDGYYLRITSREG